MYAATICVLKPYSLTINIEDRLTITSKTTPFETVTPHRTLIMFVRVSCHFFLSNISNVFYLHKKLAYIFDEINL